MQGPGKPIRLTKKHSKMFIIVVIMSTVIFHKKHVFGGCTVLPSKPSHRGVMEAYLTPELFSSEERGCPDKKGREIAPDSGSPLPSSLSHGGLTSPQPRRKVRLSRSPARPFSGKESWRPGRFVLVRSLTTQKALKGLGKFSDVRADHALWSLPASEHGQPGSLCQGRWHPGETPG